MQSQRVQMREKVARLLQGRRRERGWTQDQLAARARAVGLRWSRGSVAALETKRRDLLVYEWQMLADVLGYPSRRQMELSATGRMTKWEFLGQVGQVTVTGTAKVPSGARDLELKVARRLRKTPEQVIDHAVELWGRTLTEERDRVARLRQVEGATEHARRGRVGRITHELLKQLVAAIEEEK